ncbi:hypothetical protein [Psychrobacillus sp. L3]|uniref:hypothetical protein n=1 Tax=Psychrobacillus sp. L3 TaxID=3236891 RepID=UPI0036F2A194
MLKSVFKGVLLFFTIALTCSLVVQAEKKEQGEIEEGTEVYHVKYNYDAISNFLGMSLKAYEQDWKEGLSIADMAKKQGISRRDIEGYFYSFHYNEMQKWRAKGVLSEKHYFHLVYMLADEIEEFIDRNPNR